MQHLEESIFELIKKCTCEMPKDVAGKIAEARAQEDANSNARYILDVIVENIELAKQKQQPICQDTGGLLFFVKAPINFDQNNFKAITENTVKKAAQQGLLRPNSVDPLSENNTGDNIGAGTPYFHFEQSAQNELEICLIIKGGGSENVSAQYSLPDAKLGAERDIAGVKKCILEAITQAQGRGCAPGIISACIGGDRTTGYAFAKKQFLRNLADQNPVPELAKLEQEIFTEANQLDIGPMGLGGKSTLLDCKIGILNRHPACYYVTVSYMCWAFRRQGIKLNAKGNILEWLY
ncbi:MAG: fumarate hydratase [Pseudomonadota bacterium]